MAKSIYKNIKPTTIFFVAGIILLLVSFFVWWKFIFTSPASVFDRMLSNSLSSPAVTKQMHQEEEGQNLHQVTDLQTSPHARTHSISYLSQASGTNQTLITTENIGTLGVDYVRYKDIKTSQTSPDGKPFDFSSVLNIWGKTPENSLESNAQQFNQTLLGVVPIANVPQPKRGQLLNQIRGLGVYEINNNTVKRQYKNGRLIYTYDVKIAPSAYVSMLKAFSRSLGITILERVDPNQYMDSPPLKLSFEIDVLSGQLKKIIHSDTGRTEEYSAFGVRQIIGTPKTAIDVNELQTRLQQLR